VVTALLLFLFGAVLAEHFDDFRVAFLIRQRYGGLTLLGFGIDIRAVSYEQCYNFLMALPGRSVKGRLARIVS